MMTIKWRTLTRAQRMWAAVVATLWTCTLTLIGWLESDRDGSITRREILGFTTLLVLSSCSTVCLKIENSQARINRAFQLGYRVRSAELGGCHVGRNVVPLQIRGLDVPPVDHVDSL